jgi:hypothetical protein
VSSSVRPRSRSNLARRGAALPAFVPPQLSQLVAAPHRGRNGCATLARRLSHGCAHRQRTRATPHRTGLDCSSKYPFVIAALASLNVKAACIDCELCGIDDAGLPRASPISPGPNAGVRGVSGEPHGRAARARMRKVEDAPARAPGHFRRGTPGAARLGSRSRRGIGRRPRIAPIG